MIRVRVQHPTHFLIQIFEFFFTFTFIFVVVVDNQINLKDQKT